MGLEAVDGERDLARVQARSEEEKVSHEIILMRHGQPDLASVTKVSARDMQHWIEQYDLAGIVDGQVPVECQALASHAKTIVSSTAPRALASVRALGLQPSLVDKVFCEAQLPHGKWARPRLSPFTWAFIFRLSWLAGYAGKVESARDAGRRADMAAQQLQSLAADGPVLLLGHGFMNRMIAKRLKSAGWTQHHRGGSRYWSATIYRKAPH